MISGVYLGEIARLVIKKFVTDTVLFAEEGQSDLYKV